MPPLEGVLKNLESVSHGGELVDIFNVLTRAAQKPEGREGGRDGERKGGREGGREEGMKGGGGRERGMEGCDIVL